MIDLTHEEFDLLCNIEKNGIEFINHSNLKQPQIYEKFKNLNLIDLNGITKNGLDTLEPYKVKTAIFLAAGCGTRLSPVTDNLPKPLVKVNGIRIIENLITAVINAKIENIIIVRGYLKDEFDVLLEKYPCIKFVDNPMYNTSNTITSALCVKEHLSNAYIFESDLILLNQNIISKYNFSTHYVGAFYENTDDWCFDVENGFIENVRIGGENVYRLYGISYWDKNDGAKLSKDIQRLYESEGGLNYFWDVAPTMHYKEDYKLRCKECNSNDIAEVDTLQELAEIDHSYKRFL